MPQPFDARGQFVGMPKHLNPYVNYGMGQKLNRNTGQVGNLYRTSSTSAAFSAPPPSAPPPQMPDMGGGFDPGPGGPIDAPGEVPTKVPKVAEPPSLKGLRGAGGDGSGDGMMASNDPTLKYPIGNRNPPSLAALLNGLRY